MKWLTSIFQFFFSLYALVVFVALMLLLFPLFLLAALGGNIKGGNAIMRLCRFWGDCWLFLVGIQHRVSEENRPDPRKAYIFVGNHISYIDAAFIITSVRQPFRALGAAEYGRYPIFGYIYRLVVICVHRKDPNSRAQSVETLRSYLRLGISVLIYPEGSFNMGSTALSNFYNGAFRLAIETQTPIKPLLFLDGYDRMHYRSLFTVNPGRSRAIFLEAVPVDGYTLDDLAALKQKVYEMMESQLLQRKASWVKS